MKLKTNVKNHLLTIAAAIALVAAPTVRAAEAKEWSFDVSLYALGLGIDGDLGVGPLTVPIDVGTDKIVENLEFGFMGFVRVGYGRWTLSTEALFMGLQGSKDGVTAELDQWLIEPSLSYRLSKHIEPFVGVRYNSLEAELRGPGKLPTPVIPTGTQDWWDPVIGANLALPLGKSVAVKFRGDIGGFGVGSEITWQLYPYLDWRFTRWGSLQVGYRWLYMDYETGAGADRFQYTTLNEGAQLGFTIHF
jgi:hypothetical protein